MLCQSQPVNWKKWRSKSLLKENQTRNLLRNRKPLLLALLAKLKLRWDWVTENNEESVNHRLQLVQQWLQLQHQELSDLENGRKETGRMMSTILIIKTSVKSAMQVEISSFVTLALKRTIWYVWTRHLTNPRKVHGSAQLVLKMVVRVVQQDLRNLPKRLMKTKKMNIKSIVRYANWEDSYFVVQFVPPRTIWDVWIHLCLRYQMASGFALDVL